MIGKYLAWCGVGSRGNVDVAGVIQSGRRGRGRSGKVYADVLARGRLAYMRFNIIRRTHSPQVHEPIHPGVGRFGNAPAR